MKTFWKRFWDNETFAARVISGLLVVAATVCGGVAIALPNLKVLMLAVAGMLVSLSQLIPKGDFTTTEKVATALVDPSTLLAPKSPPPPSSGFISARILISVLLMSFVGAVACAFLGRVGNNTVSCAESDPALEAQVIDALVDLEEEQWMGALVALVPDKTLRDCLLAGILSAYENPDGGFVYTLPDGGMISPARLTSAKQLAETDKERVGRRAAAYFALTK